MQTRSYTTGLAVSALVVGVYAFAARHDSELQRRVARKAHPVSDRAEVGRRPADPLPPDVDASGRLELPQIDRTESPVVEPECSPFDLLPVDEATKYGATRENLREWFEPLAQGVDWDAVEYDADLAGLWQDCRDSQAFRAFCVGYLDREIERWKQRESSVELWDEITPAAQWSRAQGLMTTEVTSALDAYERDVLDLIHSEGFDAEQSDDPESRWDLLRALGDASSPSWEAVLETLKRYSK